MKFTKMNGLGNDYIYINATEIDIENPSKLAIKLSDRHFGVGGDGLVLIKKSERADFCMKMYNLDGSESEMCGNAIRCVGKYVFDKGLTKKTVITVDTLAGIKEVRLKISDNKVIFATVNMGYPKFFDYEPLTITVLGRVICGYKVCVGNPHFVVFVDDFWNEMMKTGEELCNNTAVFPQKTNVEFAKIIDEGHIKMRVYERGSGETLSCGTGAIAVFFAANAKKNVESFAKISLLGGTFSCQKTKEGYLLTGKVETNFEGETI